MQVHFEYLTSVCVWMVADALSLRQGPAAMDKTVVFRQQ